MSSGGYDPRAIEPDILSFWEQGGFFHADPDPVRPPYTIVIPPPNVTGALHLGHALNNTLQDILIRTHRMRGYSACWLPGTDHAGIATQAVVERLLREKEGKTRHEVGREGLVERIWQWKEEYGNRILEQLRRMGCSCDWRRTRFTLDEQCAKAVYEMFFRMFRDGLIYRGKRLVNWDTQLQTAIADDEVYHEEVRGSLWHIRYPLVDAPDQHLVIATTRPETLLADVAVAVHPGDPRHQHLIGKHVTLPLTGRTIPVIADGELVNPEFGTGCVKVTPAHDPNDYACWQRKQGQPDQIEIRNMMTPDGRIHADNAGDAGRYAGLKLDEARKRIVADLEAAGLLERVEPYTTQVGHSDRSKTQIQPYLSEQWFVKMDRLAELAMEAVRDGRVRFYPERFAKTYLDWLGEKRDWCISRQLWWGHRIPVWSFPSVAAFRAVFRAPDGKLKARLKEFEDQGIAVRRGETDLDDVGLIGEPPEADHVTYTFPSGLTLESVRWDSVWCVRQEYLAEYEAFATSIGMIRDPDVLDTWFSSALWPISTFGWPTENRTPTVREGLERLPHSEEGTGNPSGATHDSQREHTSTRSLPEPLPYGRGSVQPVPATQGAELDYFFPTSVLSTARDIISLWVARMVMAGLYNLGRVPFQHVYIHPTIQDGQGRRMSKSLGNGVDPVDLIDLYGTDAMRFVLAGMAGDTQDARVPVKPVTLPDGRQVNSSERFELGRNFCNKLWQVTTGFVLPNLSADGQSPAPAMPLDPAALPAEDRWILSRLRGCLATVDRCAERYEFSELTRALYEFFWSDFCDWYVELVKPRLFRREGDQNVKLADPSAATARQVLALTLDVTLRMLHPVMPFITEALWRKLNAAAPQRGLSAIRAVTERVERPPTPALRDAAGGRSVATEICPALILAEWPAPADLPQDAAVEREISQLIDVIVALRQVRTNVNGLRSAAKQPALRTLPRAVVRTDELTAAALRGRVAQVQRLGTVDALEIGPSVAKPPESAAVVLAGIEVFVPLAGLADLNAERQRLSKERDEALAGMARINAKLGNEGFVAKAPPAVIEQERARLAELADRVAKIESNLRELE